MFILVLRTEGWGEMRENITGRQGRRGGVLLCGSRSTPHKEALGLSVEDLIPEHLKAQLRARMVRFRETSRGTHTNSHQLQDLPAVHKEGREIRIKMSLSPIGSVHDSNDERFVLAIVRDITERERTHERLIESERRFVNVLSNARAYVYRCLNEPGWPNEFVSDYALELTGYSPEDLLVGGTVRFGDLIVEEDRRSSTPICSGRSQRPCSVRSWTLAT